ncbi:Photosynthetic NDH subunit of lumenal location 2 [Arabidopsis thaliana]|uniref:Photosynthetic NDH subunit of lumenal location 2, chloroplastic n=4 Tax=Arabidopsis TaxID=3701 RepID=PNSL2_ARATH|nr:PsbQ-like 2 [Arabidopsis thaliana]Q9XI73.1 RecName: Full=Photosynthetic NDH subunit of lumenal location 2, chloroplastic; AltName: Full=PsbQ-like protein 1; Flags: Precursor [Arabidopsis thaliana]7WFF_g Chain g, Photosynthetic NDH subunit of lumenal location 2, chloroplastic [Arabidopsis thaliana]7WG5_g Chain g, Photosynthetic NDH subunit of lumenal location 2, chloroplastic [Arabidopsis thaliana]KAG7596981.1 PsbQ-like domain superfamily [Arabidopsis suecica]KAG7646259.1 PsbQ-like domain su|eukprot:NP_563937.1 PsbQ-like 2 [Arabidopsis thaliana]
MSSFTTTNTPPPYLLRKIYHRRVNQPFSVVCCTGEPQQDIFTRRRTLTSLITFTVIGGATSSALAQEKWGTRSFIKEKYFMPGLSPEDAAARIKQTAEGLRDMREMLDHMSWRYVIFYIRLKQAYLSQDLTNAMNILPESRRNDYVQAANELVENMSELDFYVRTPKVYESYLYYEKTLKSIDNVVEFLA